MRTQLAERLLQIAEAIDGLTKRGYRYLDNKILPFKDIQKASDCSKAVHRLRGTFDDLVKKHNNVSLTTEDRINFDWRYSKGNNQKFNEVLGELIIDNLNEDSVPPEIYSALIKTIAYFENKGE